ncbi:ArgS-related anticodon-binding protein NrtL [Streptomyces sp. XY152]|uniref:ArgS-related anticodon-binding protein NrtL n=1 Tax=Streptomyces sp. XY152 TaxID=1415560 RepID=UPI0006AF7A8E|nr:DALR anticodon-binding domain-containing protein [Streptomyces sp. XY152]
MTPVELSRTVLHAVRRAVDEGELRVAVLPERVRVTPPGPGGCGDYATNVALQLARPAGEQAQRVAEILRPRLLGAPGISDVVVTGPGFLNISLARAGSAGLVREILRCGSRYGHGDALRGHTVRLRAVPEVRAVVQAEALGRILRSQGAVVHLDDLDHLDDGPGAVVRPVPAPADPLPLGRDAARWALLYPAPHDRPRIGGEHLVQREGNPLFRVRYAHARTRALLRNAADLGFEPEPGPVAEDRTLVQVLADHPRILAAAAVHRAPDRLARQLVAVADAVLPLFPAVLPLGEEKPSAAHRARLALADAAGTVLAGGLSLLGIDAPDHL